MFSKKGYKNLEEWKVDSELMKSSPNDEKLAVSIAKKIDNSEEKIREAVIVYLQEEIMLSNPTMLCELISKCYPENQVVMKSKIDPWFYV